MSRLFTRIRNSFRQDDNLSPNNRLEQDNALQEELRSLRLRVDYLEHRLVNYYRNRWDVVDCVADYLVNAELPGDYAEFGVYKGTTFGYAANLFHPLFPQMRFLAFDSFEGLPEPEGLDRSEEGFASGFFKGQFTSTKDEFINNVRAAAPYLPSERLFTIKGWFDKELTRENAQKINLQKLSCVWIDCDFYESTVPVLKFITPYLSIGSVILFDDWRCYRNLANHGEQRACREWLEKNGGLTLNDFISFGFHGMSFTVASLPTIEG
jgi:O-methyltransferase